MDVDTFGLVETASSDDYKNRAFFEIEAKQLMIMQVNVVYYYSFVNS